MTPKQKAIEFTHKFCSFTEGYFGSKKNMIAAKNAALVAVDELIYSTLDGTLIEDNDLSDKYTYQYWQQVKQEIEKL